MQTIDPLIGRDAELRALGDALTSRRPAFLVIAGAAGMGKTSLLRALQERARDDGWRVVPDGGETIEVHEGMSVASLQERLEGRLADAGRHPEREPFASPDPAPADGTSQTLLAAVQSLLAGSRLAPAGRRAHAVGGLLDLLGQLAPVLLALDVRTPDPSVRSWLTERLWPAVRDAGIVAVPVALAGDRHDEQALAEAATLVVRLGPLDTGAVRSHLDKVAGGLPAGELDAYAEAISHDPGLLASFFRLLPLLARPATSTPSPRKEGGGQHA